jgi:hypothetical protein
VALAFGVLAATAGLRVETGTPDALCPDIAQVRAAIEARLGDIEGVGRWLASYTLVHRPDQADGDVVRLELRDPTGRLRLRRDLPRTGESCEAVVQAMVIVLDSYFRRPADEAAAETGDADAPPALAHTEQPQPPALGPALEVIAGWADAPAGAAFVMGLHLAGRSAWAGGVDAAWLQAEDHATMPATASMRSYVLRGYLARAFQPTPSVTLLTGPEAMLALDHAASPVFAGSGSWRAAPGAGARFELRLRLLPHVSLAVVAALDWSPRALTSQFGFNQGATFTEVLPAPELRLLVGAGLMIALFP